MIVHLVDGTYELFRHHFAVPAHLTDDGKNIGAVRGVVGSLLQMLEQGATHVGVATDHVVESFRNELYDGYKDGSGLEEEIAEQFHPLEDALRAAGFVVFPMVEYEADDGLASAARIAATDERVERVVICTPDKDLGQCVTADGRVVQYDRRKDLWIDRDAVIAKFGVPPESIPDYLGLVGDTADGFPGLPGWGAKSTATVLARYGRIEDIPEDVETWDVKVRGARRLSATLNEQRDAALLFRRIATVAEDAPTLRRVDDLRWTGPDPSFEEWADRMHSPRLLDRARRLAARRA